MRVSLNKSKYSLEKYYNTCKDALDKKGFQLPEFSKIPPITPEGVDIKCKWVNGDAPAFVKVQVESRATAYVCPHCGSELLGYWERLLFLSNNYSEGGLGKRYGEAAGHPFRKYAREAGDAYFNSMTEKDMEAANTLEKCSVCGGALSREDGYYSVYEGDWTRDAVFVNLREKRRNVYKADADEMTKDFMMLCDLPAAAAASADQIHAVKNDPEKLQAYVLSLIKLETNIYGVSQRLSQLYSERMDNALVLEREMNCRGQKEKKDLNAAKKHLEKWEGKLNKYRRGIFDIAEPVMPVPPVLAKPGLFNKKKVEYENNTLLAQYNMEVKSYNMKLASYENNKRLALEEAEEQVAMMRNRIPELENIWRSSLIAAEDSPAKLAKGMIDTETAEAEATLKKLYEGRNALYACDIVFGKYRDVVALSVFYEYLAAGRCTTLDGRDGAYNLYESELRADKIIGQLNQVIDQLDEIKNTQYMIWSEMQRVNDGLKRLNNTMNEALGSIRRMEKNTAVIAHNSAVTAYYSRVNAELTGALGFMLAL